MHTNVADLGSPHSDNSSSTGLSCAGTVAKYERLYKMPTGSGTFPQKLILSVSNRALSSRLLFSRGMPEPSSFRQSNGERHEELGKDHRDD